MSSGSLIVHQQRKCIRRFREAGAVAAEQARTPAELGQREGFVMRRLLAAGVLREANSGRYYLDEARAEVWRQQRRMRVLLTLMLGLALLLIAYLIRGF